MAGGLNIYEKSLGTSPAGKSLPPRATPPELQVLFVDPVGSRGGAERSMFELASALGKMHVGVAAVLPDGEASCWFKSSGINVFPCQFLRLRKPSFLHPFRKTGLLSVRFVHDAVTKAASSFFKPDSRRVVVANNFAALLASPREAGTTTIWHVRDFAPQWQVAIGIRKADLVFAISKPVFERLRGAVSPRYGDKIRLVENGIDVSRFANAASAPSFKVSHSIPRETRIVAMAANIVPWKRHDLFIETAAILAARRKDLRFVIAGADLFGEHRGYAEKLEHLASQCGLNGVLLFVRDIGDITGLLRDSAVLVHPTPSEPFGRVVCEAMACGVPVVASTKGGPSSIVENGRTGILVDGDNPSCWADAVSRILESDTYARRLSQEAARAVPNIQATARQLIDVINKRNPETQRACRM